MRSQWHQQLEKFDPFAHHKMLHQQFNELGLLQETLYSDMNSKLPDQYLDKVDRATMANSLEVRVPFLDNNLAAYVMPLPASYKVKRWWEVSFKAGTCWCGSR